MSFEDIKRLAEEVAKQETQKPAKQQPAKPLSVWTGASGTQYRYSVFSLPSTFTPDQSGNYIYAKLNAASQWVPIYFGEGELRDRCSDAHHKAACIAIKGATHFHCHLNPVEADRLKEEKDLLASYPQAYAPAGCNEAIGG